MIGPLGTVPSVFEHFRLDLKDDPRFLRLRSIFLGRLLSDISVIDDRIQMLLDLLLQEKTSIVLQSVKQDFIWFFLELGQAHETPTIGAAGEARVVFYF